MTAIPSRPMTPLAVTGRQLRATAATLALALAGSTACVPVTVNVTFPQEKLEHATGNI